MPVGLRATSSGVLLLCVAACFRGAGANGLPCDNDAQCGVHVRCEMNFCGGPPDDSTGNPSSTTTSTAETLSTSVETGSSGSSTLTQGSSETTSTAESTTESSESGGIPGRCNGPGNHGTATATAVGASELDNATAVVTGDFVGGPASPLVDIAVLNATTREVVVLENEGGLQFDPHIPMPSDLTESYDLELADLDGSGDVGDLIVAGQGTMGVLPRNAADDGYDAPQPIDIAGVYTFSLASGDLFGDANPEVVVAAGGQVRVLPNVGGTIGDEGHLVLTGDFFEPWDTLVFTLPGGAPRIAVPSTNIEPFMTTDLHPVFLLEATASSLDYTAQMWLDEEFENAWAVVAADVDGDGMQELAVAERRSTGDDGNGENTTNPGRLRLFRVGDDDEVDEVLDTPLELTVGVWSLAAADMDADGCDDLLVGANGTATGSSQPQIVFGADSLDALEVSGPIGSLFIEAGNRLAVGNLDDDPRPEAVYPDYGSMADPGDRLVVVDVD